MVDDIDYRKFTSGYMMTFVWGFVSWQAWLQKCFALSTADVKYIALLWTNKFLQEFGVEQ